MARLNIEVDPETRKALRIAALEADVPMRAIVEALVRRFLTDTTFRDETIRRLDPDPPEVVDRTSPGIH